jgi:hypothetical protein
MWLFTQVTHLEIRRNFFTQVTHLEIRRKFFTQVTHLEIRRNFFTQVTHLEIRRTRKRISSQKWTLSLVKQGKFKVGAVPAEGLGRFLVHDAQTGKMYQMNTKRTKWS